MVIDTTLCIGCNTCVLACQAENNIPVVGPVEVSRGRDDALDADRHLRSGSDEDPRPGFQPVPCMHCEQAPCEPVCPVEASVHDNEGLNVQVYNRCIGTRFCELNCPYKVRRFNFFAYNNGQEFANMGEEPVLAAAQPRGHGPRARRDGEVHLLRPADQLGTPPGRDREPRDRRRRGRPGLRCRLPDARDLLRRPRQPGFPVNRLRKEPQHYAMLEHLGTRPRTTYLALLRNPNPDLEEGAS